MNYIILELQTTDGITSSLATVKKTINEAEQQYHAALAAAAMSEVEMHSASLLTERGQLIKYECFDHTEEV